MSPSITWGEAFSRQLFGNVVEQGLQIALGDVVLRVLRRDAHASAFRGDGGGDGIDDLHQEPTAVLDAAAVAIRAFVGPVAQELIDQIRLAPTAASSVEPSFTGFCSAPAAGCDYEWLELSSGGFRPTVIASRRICPSPSLARPTLRRLAFTEDLTRL